MTTLKAMVAAGNPPTASQILGYYAQDYAEAGKLGDITSLAEKEGWAKVVPAALQKFTTTDGKWGAVPVNIHSVNWVWINKALMEKIGGTEPKTFDDFVALLDKAKKAGVIPLALGGQPWQERTMFDSVVASTGGIEFYKKAFVDLDESGAEVGHDEEVVRQPRQAARLCRSQLRRPRLEPRHRDGDQGRRARAGDGRLGQGRVQARPTRKPARISSVIASPARTGLVIYNTDMFAMFDVSADRKAAQLALADATMSLELPVGVQRRQGLGPARMDVPDTAFDMCGKKGIADVKAANAAGTFVGSMAQNYAQPPAIAGGLSRRRHQVLPRRDQDLRLGGGRTRQGDQRREVSRPSRLW